MLLLFNCEKRSGGLSVNDIFFNKIKFLKLLPSCKSVHPLQRSYLKGDTGENCKPSFHSFYDFFVRKSNTHSINNGHTESQEQNGQLRCGINKLKIYGFRKHVAKVLSLLKRQS